MSQKVVEKVFKQRTFRTAKVPASEGIKMKLRVTQLFGPFFPFIFSQDKGMKDSDVVSALFEKMHLLDVDKVFNFVKYLCELCYVENEKVIFDNAFSDEDYLEPWLVAYWVLEVNFKDFFIASISRFGLNKAAEDFDQKR